MSGRIYLNCKEMISEEFRNLTELGVGVQSSTMQDKDVRKNEDFKTKELIGNSFTILDTSDKEDMYKVMKEKYNIDIPIEWAKAEFIERITRKRLNPGTAWKIRESVWKEFLHNNKFSYTYNERISTHLNRVIRELWKNQNSRQAIVSIYNIEKDIKNMGGKKRIPCSMFYQFLIREINGVKKLNIIYVMRSSDLLTHFVNDVYLAMRMQEFVAEKIDIPPGSFTMFISSFHAYYKDLKRYNIF